MLRGMSRFAVPMAVAGGAVLIVLALAGPAAGQTYQGGVRGLVRDPQGVIPGAEVTLTNEETNAVRTVVSNDVGEYVFTGVLPGVYSVRVALPGFKTEERKGLRVGTQQTLVQDFTLAGRPAVRADHRDRRGAARRAQQRHGRRRRSTRRRCRTCRSSAATPSTRRSPLPASSSRAIRSSSASRIRPTPRTCRSAAARAAATATCIEGVPMTDFINRPTIVPSIEAVEEVRVQTKTYEADMGHSAGGVFNTTARSGSNTWHGSALLCRQAGLGDRAAVLREEGRHCQPAAVLPQLGRLARRADREEPHVLLVQHRQLRAARHPQQRADAADRARTRRRFLADAQRRRPARSPSTIR